MLKIGEQQPKESKLERFYFTFGSKHINKAGEPMMDKVVLVHATDYDKARTLFVQEFMSKEMPNPNDFAFQYVNTPRNRGMILYWYKKPYKVIKEEIK